MLLNPLPLSQTVAPSWTPSPLERDVLYGRPLDTNSMQCVCSRKQKLNAELAAIDAWTIKFEQLTFVNTDINTSASSNVSEVTFIHSG